MRNEEVKALAGSEFAYSVQREAYGLQRAAYRQPLTTDYSQLTTQL